MKLINLIKSMMLVLGLLGATSLVVAKTYSSSQGRNSHSRSSSSKKRCHHRRDPYLYMGYGAPYAPYAYAPYWGPVMYPAPTYPYAVAPAYYAPGIQFGLTL